MADDTLGTSLNVQGPTQLVESKMNKVQGGVLAQTEGVTGELVDEYTLDLDDKELLELAKKWENKYAIYEGRLKPRQDANKKYYLGKQDENAGYVTGDQPIASNLLFEAEETFLPAALSKNPEPVVYADNSTEGNKMSQDVKTMLQYHADVLVLRAKLTMITRHWSIYFIGVLKHGWDEEINDIKTEVRDPRNFIFNPDCSVDAYGDMEGYIGERITCTATELIEMFPKHETHISLVVDGKLGTDVTYTEWWNDDYCFYTFNDVVLDKNKNPHFVYDKVITTVDAEGEQEEVEDKGSNHFAKPKKPYTFLSVFSLGEQPHDITGLIEQNIPNQNLISRRTKQIDSNLSRANNSIAFSENNFNQETGKQASAAMEAGRPILVPQGGPISEAIVRFDAPGFPNAAFTDLEQNKLGLRSIFGTQGITSQEPDDDQTARGMILQQQFDTSRIGGGIGDRIEQVADNVFNWWYQLYKVYYDDMHFAAIMGQMKAVEYVQFNNLQLGKSLVISVSPNSMAPKDEVTQMNQALELYKMGVLDPKTLFTILNIPDVQQTSENTVLWLLDKQTYFQKNFPELAAEMAQQQQAAQMAAQGAQAGGVGVGEGGVPMNQPNPPSADPASAALENVPLPQ